MRFRGGFIFVAFDEDEGLRFLALENLVGQAARFVGVDGGGEFLEQFRSNVNREAILSDWKNCSNLKNRSISYSEILWATARKSASEPSLARRVAMAASMMAVS